MLTTIKKSDIFSCYKNTKNTSTLPQISSQPPPFDKYIFFLDTTCKSKEEGNIRISVHQACSVEAAAVTNPNYKIYLLYASPGAISNTTSLNDRILTALQSYKNIKINWINVEDYFIGTPTERLYKKSKYYNYN